MTKLKRKYLPNIKPKGIEHILFNYSYLFLFVFSIVLSYSAEAQEKKAPLFSHQDINSNLESSCHIGGESNSFYLNLMNLNFFKNDEFFSPLSSGLTYIGFDLRPTIEYQAYPQLRLSLGLDAIKFSGIDYFSKIRPIYTINYQPIEGFNLLMGVLNGGLNHGLHEGLYTPENHILRPVETGIQILVDKFNLKADIWLDWRRFIFKDSQSQEKIIGGSHINYIFFQKGNTLFDIDFQSLISHRGGQFSAPGQTLQTIINTSSGLGMKHYIDNHNYWGINTKYLSYEDASSESGYPYIMGWASASSVFLNYRFLRFSLEYWHGKYFVSSLGQPLLMCISEKDESYKQSYTQVLSSKIRLHKEICPNVFLELRFEPYLDLYDRQFNYSYSLHLIFNDRFFIWKKK